MTIENATDDVIVEDAVQNEEPISDSGVTTEVQEEVQQTEEETRDDFYKNRSYELERKLSNLTNDIPKIIEENLAKQNTNNQQEQKEYSIAELEAYALEHPEHRPWVEEQKETKRQKQWEKLLRDKDQEVELKQRKAQSEQKVLNDPKYAEAFVTVNGTKVFNDNSPLAHAMYGYMQDSRVKGLPDALEVAAKLARADLIDQSVQTKEQKLTTLKRQNTQLKQQTMVESAGVVDMAPVKDSFQKAQERLSQTGNRRDAEDAVKEYFKKIRG